MALQTYNERTIGAQYEEETIDCSGACHYGSICIDSYLVPRSIIFLLKLVRYPNNNA